MTLNRFMCLIKFKKHSQTKETCHFTHKCAKDKQDCGWMHIHNRMDIHSPKYFWSRASFKKKQKNILSPPTQSCTTHKNSPTVLEKTCACAHWTCTKAAVIFLLLFDCEGRGREGTAPPGSQEELQLTEKCCWDMWCNASACQIWIKIRPWRNNAINQRVGLLKEGTPHRMFYCSQLLHRVIKLTANSNSSFNDWINFPSTPSQCIHCPTCRDRWSIR